MSADATKDVDATAPADSAGDGVVCACGHVNPVGADLCQRLGCRRVLKGNTLAKRHGLTVALPSEAIVDARDAFIAASIADDGGETEVPTRRRSLHEYRGRLHVQIVQLSSALERHGIFDKRGRLRGLWLQRLEGLVDRARAIDGTLGLNRRAKSVPSLNELMADGERR